MEKWTGFRGCNSGSRVARAKWSSSADSSYKFPHIAIIWHVVAFSGPKIEGDIAQVLKN